MRNIPGIARRGRRMFLECRKILLLWCQKRLREEWQRSCPKCFAQKRIAFFALSVNLTSFSWTHKLGFTPEQLRRHPGTQVKQTRNQLRIVPRMTLILKQGFFCAIPTRLLPRWCLRQRSTGYWCFISFKDFRPVLFVYRLSLWSVYCTAR